MVVAHHRATHSMLGPELYIDICQSFDRKG
jgi:hypothetical protein